MTADAFQKAYFNDLQEEAFDDAIHTNSTGPFWLTFAFLPLLEKWKELGYRSTSNGRRFAPQVVMTSSMNGWTKDPATAGFSFPYLFSKSAIGHATETLAHELLPLGIRVNGIAPGKALHNPLGRKVLIHGPSRLVHYRDVRSGFFQQPRSVQCFQFR